MIDADVVEKWLRQQIGEVPTYPAYTPVIGILNQANVFLLAARRSALSKEIEPGRYQSLTAPSIVCAAFACELYLKGLNLYYGTASRGHNLLTLFEALPDSVRRALANRFSELRGHYRSGDFHQKIEALSRAFVDWRYMFEHDDLVISPQVLFHVDLCLYKLARAIIPDWNIDEASVADIEKPLDEEIASTIYLGSGRAVRAIIRMPQTKVTVRYS